MYICSITPFSWSGLTCGTVPGPRAAGPSWQTLWICCVAASRGEERDCCWPSGSTGWSECPDWSETPWRTDGSWTRGRWPTPRSDNTSNTQFVLNFQAVIFRDWAKGLKSWQSIEVLSRWVEKENRKIESGQNKLTWYCRMMVHMRPRMMDGLPSIISGMWMLTSLIWGENST